MTLSLQWNECALEYDDFERFAALFRRTVAAFLPCRSVGFVPMDLVPAAGKKLPADSPVELSWLRGARLVRKQRKPVRSAAGPHLFLPVWKEDELLAVAVLLGENSSVYKETSDSWLLDRSRIISREFQMVKQWSVDPATGLLNSYHFREEIKSLFDGTGKVRTEKNTNDSCPSAPSVPCNLVLVEMYPRPHDADKAHVYIYRAASYLKSLIGGYSPLHYLGFGVFGLIWYDIGPEQALKAADTLLHRLMHERFSRVHIGIAPGPKNEKEDGKSAGSVSGDGEMLLAEAWQALKTARRRGPYALCSYASLQDPAKHPLRNPSSHVMSVLKRQWSGKDHFALVLLRRDQKTEETGFSKRISSLIGPDHPVFFENNREAFVFLDDAAEQEALDWITRFKSRLKTPSGSALFREDVTFSAGIALYPCFDFKKSAMPAGARKALKHTEFFGPDTMTVFDGVSLNISGDIYYNEGDLARAVKEYRKGLVLDPENINLMNSLAVAYAQMNRYQKAIPLLERALLIDEADFMALLNLGFAYLATGQQGAAVESFERALAIDDNHFDLLLQLGKQYCLLERFEEARELLVRCKGRLLGMKEEAGRQGETKTGLDGYGARPRDVDQGVVSRYLGMAYKGLGDSHQAMVCLQEAAKFNPWDVTALCILGELYALEKQGNDIAESLCRQAIALDDSRSSCWRALAHVQFLNRDFEAARESLKQALRLDRNNIEALLLAGRVYEKLGQDSRGVKMYERVLRLDAANRKALQAVKRLRGKKRK